jgi:hypothetical protein
MANEIIPATSFAISPHSDGPILTVLNGKTVAANIRLSVPLIWLLARSLGRVLINAQIAGPLSGKAENICSF